MQQRLIHTTCGVLAIGFISLSLSQVLADDAKQPGMAMSTSKPVATQPATTTVSAPAVTWEDAGKHVGETVTITGPVMGTHVTTGGKSLVLNIGKDFPDASRFSVMIKNDENHPTSADDFKGKSITVTGKVELYKEVAEMKVKPTDVTVNP